MDDEILMEMESVMMKIFVKMEIMKMIRMVTEYLTRVIIVLMMLMKIS